VDRTILDFYEPTHLFTEVMKVGYVKMHKNYRLQAEVVSGKRPDTLVEVVGVKYVVVDCEASQGLYFSRWGCPWV
jgi:hypothetical protein